MIFEFCDQCSRLADDPIDTRNIKALLLHCAGLLTGNDQRTANNSNQNFVTELAWCSPCEATVTTRN